MAQRYLQVDIKCHAPLNKMEYDEACLHVVNTLNTTITLMTINSECYKCNKIRWFQIEPGNTEELAVFIEYSPRFEFISERGNSCEITHTFQQHGVYKWIADFNCQPVVVIQQPNFMYLPLVVYYGIFQALFILYLSWKLVKRHNIHHRIFNKFKKKKQKPDTTESDVSGVTVATTASRITQTTKDSEILPVPQVLSIHVFRGIVVILTVVTHGAYAKYHFMNYSPWNGISLTDCISAWFPWSMGALMYLKYRASLLLGATRRAVIFEVVLRSCGYFILGLFMNSFERNFFANLRYPGILQNYGILHLFMFILEVSCMKKNVDGESTLWKARELLDSWVLIVFTLACLGVNLLVTYFLPVPGCPTGYLGPGGNHLYSRYENCTGGAAGYLDRLIIGPNHIFFYPSYKAVYKSKVPYDPTGILPTLNSFLTVFSGMHTAKIFVYYSKFNQQLSLLLFWGLLQSILGLCLCGFVKEEGPIPLNLSLWSPSFTLLTSGMAVLIFAVIYFGVDLRKWWSGSPFFEAGLNAMLIFIGSHFLRYSFPFSWNPVSNHTYFEHNLMAIISAAFWICVAIFAYKHNRIVLI